MWSYDHMDSRPLLNNTKKIGVHIDSNSFSNLLDQQNRLAIAVLRHYDSDLLEFVRSSFETRHDDLKKVNEIKMIFDNSEIKAIKIAKKESDITMAFGYRKNDIQEVTKKIFGNDNVEEYNLNKIITVLIQAIFNRSEEPYIHITNDKKILKNRLWFESHFPGQPLNIMSIEEASIFLDLFFKRNGNYYTSSRFRLNKGLWYWYSMRLKIPHFNVGDTMIDALANRLCYAIMALDEIGIQYYLGVNNDTMDNTLYHYNFLISLITGVFDNLALKTNTHLRINILDLRKVSLLKKSGKEFLGKVRDENIDIRSHINSYVIFINLIYELRELIIHREGLPKIAFEHRDDNIRWKANFIRISEKTSGNIKNCGDRNSEYDSFSKWGFFNMHTELFLEPYHFSIQALKTLIKFTDKYLELLGYSSFIEGQRQKEDTFAHDLKIFEEFHLGF